jgi:hypothetical protein
MNRIISISIIALLFACDSTPEAVDELDAAEQVASPAGESPTAVPVTSGAADQVLQVHWVHLPGFADVLGHSQVIVRGEVVGTSFDAIRHHDPEDPSVYEDLPLTISALAVREVLHGTLGDDVSEVIDVQELGGRLRSGAFTYPEDKPPLQPGQEVVLCLQSNGAGRWSVIGGTQGRFAVVGGKLEPLFTGEDFKRFEGAPLEVLTAAIAEFTRTRV